MHIDIHRVNLITHAEKGIDDHRLADNTDNRHCVTSSPYAHFVEVG